MNTAMLPLMIVAQLVAAVYSLRSAKMPAVIQPNAPAKHQERD